MTDSGSNLVHSLLLVTGSIMKFYPSNVMITLSFVRIQLSIKKTFNNNNHMFGYNYI